MTNELTPYIKYHLNGNVWIKGQNNSVGQHEGIEEIFWENGNIRWRTPYVGGKMDGIVEEFYENGNIEIRTPYVEGKRDGIAEYFYADGNIEIRTSYVEDKLDGIEEWFNEQGNITRTLVWKNGELIEETKH
jgi:antitoxin component YwqK of YwqJK toxin-antitoxin module